MTQSIENSLLEAIKKDDIKAFGALMERAQCGAYRLGRFPVLSLMYLYKSRRLISAYEEKFISITSYNALNEPIEISNRFSAKAGKCLRLYLNEIVSPLEMLLILDKTRRLTRVYPLANNSSAAVKWRLNRVYFIKYSLGVKFEGVNIIIEKRPLNNREKKRIATICMSVILALIIVIGVPVTTVSIIPKPIPGEVTKLSQIDFASDEEYTLKKDITLPENYTVEKVNCTIIGDGHKLIFSNGAAFETFNGKLSNMTIESNGEPIIKLATEKASIESVTVNINADITTDGSTSLFVLSNYGTIKNATLNVSGKIKAVAGEDNSDFTIGGMVQNNCYISYDNSTNTYYSGVIEDCAVNYTQFTLEGESSANAAFGGIVGTNEGQIISSTVTGEISSNTLDIAGLCVVNAFVVSGSVNEANLTQTSDKIGWNPIVCGIVITNYYSYVFKECENRGIVTSKSTSGQSGEEDVNNIAIAAGIVYQNLASDMQNCANLGSVQSSSEYAEAYAAGIAYQSASSAIRVAYIVNSVNSGSVQSSAAHKDAYAAGICVISSNSGIDGGKNGGTISAIAGDGCDTYAGGISALEYGYVTKSVNVGAVSATCSGAAYIGGISAYSYAPFSYCISGGTITATAENIYAGGIFGYGMIARSSGNNYNFSSADNCISESVLSVTANDEGFAYVGGIVGYVPEAEEEEGVANPNYIGYVSNCYFIGELKTEATYFGAIVGVFGANVFETGSYVSGYGEYAHFENNYYLNDFAKAFGATIAGEDEYASVQDEGATSAAIDEIKSIDAYKTILNMLQSLYFHN